MKRNGKALVVGLVVALGALLNASAASALWADFRGSYTVVQSQNVVANKDQENDGFFTSGQYYRFEPFTRQSIVNKKGPGEWAKTGSGLLVLQLRSCEAQGGIRPMACGSWYYEESYV